MRVRVLLQRCLKKDPKQRLQAIGDARIALDEVLSGAPDLALVGRAEADAVPFWPRALPWAVASVAVAATVVLGLILAHRTNSSASEPIRLQIPLSAKPLCPWSVSLHYPRMDTTWPFTQSVPTAFLAYGYAP